MKSDFLIRERLLIGDLATDLLKDKHILVIGLGGVGGFATECLVRAGIYKLTLADFDIVDLSNKNRQLIALDSTIGQNKALVLKERLLDINQDLEINLITEFLDEEAMQKLIEENHYAYVLDCIDTLSPKIALIEACVKNKLKLISAMGAGGKLDPEQIRICDISQSYNCTLAKSLRKRLSPLGIKTGFTCVFSPEAVDKSKLILTDGKNNKKSIIGTIAWMPPLFGAFMSSKVIRDLIKDA